MHRTTVPVRDTHHYRAGRSRPAGSTHETPADALPRPRSKPSFDVGCSPGDFPPYISSGILIRMCSTIGGDILVARRSFSPRKCIAGVLWSKRAPYGVYVMYVCG